MKKVLIGLLVISIAGNAYLLMQPKTVVKVASDPETVVMKSSETIVVEDKQSKTVLTEALEKNKLLEQKLTALQNELNLVNERIALAELDEELKKIKEIPLDKSGLPDPEVLDKFKQKEESIADLYQKEPINSEWAYATQDKLNRLLNEKGDMSMYEISKLECKTSVCKMELKPYSDSNGAGMAVGMNAMMSISGDEAMNGFITTFDMTKKDGENPGMVNLYVARRVKGK